MRNRRRGRGSPHVSLSMPNLLLEYCLHPAKMNCGMTPAGVCAGEQPVGGERAAHSASSHRPGRDGNVRESWRLQDTERRKSTHLIKLIIYQIRRDRLRWSDGLRQHCPNKNVGGRKSWRLPSFPELASLIDPSNANPTLPTGHPFTNVQSAHYWSATAMRLTLPSSRGSWTSALAWAPAVRRSSLAAPGVCAVR